MKLGHQPVMRANELLPDLAAFRPSFILAVPYIFEKIFHAARRKAEREGRTGPFDKAVDVAVKHAEAMEHKAFGLGPGPSAGLRIQHQFFEKAVYSKVRAAMGGRVRHAMSGGSGMDRRLGLFFEGAGVTVFEGYGLTESSAAATANPPERTRYGTVGQPIPGTTVHIAKDGEVWLHGGHVFNGYLNDPKATEAVLRDGWLATGDLGALDEDGYLTITGRKKEILVTSGGKSVSRRLLRSAYGRTLWSPSASWSATTARTSPRWSPSTRRRWSTGWRCGASRRSDRSTWCATRIWSWRSGGRWWPPTRWCRRPSRSVRSGSWPIPSARSTDC